MNHENSQYQNITTLDVLLAKQYAPILLQLAIDKKTTTYAGLIEAARLANPTEVCLFNAIPVSTGRRLDIIKIITAANGLPNLTALVVSSSTDRPGALGPQDPAVLSQVMSFDWQQVELSFDEVTKFVVERDEKKQHKKKIMKPEEAKNIMVAFYKENKTVLPHDIKMYRDEIIGLIRNGMEAEQAFYSFF